MKKEDVIKTYKLLSHSSETEIRLIDPCKDPSVKKPTKSIFVKTEKEFVSVCEKNEGNYNIYAGINERISKGTEKKDVISCCTLVIDIDPVRTHGIKHDPTTQDELFHAINISKEICSRLQDESKISIPSIAMSGNGAQLWFKIPKTDIIDSNRDEFEQRIKFFINQLQKSYDSSQIKIDQIGDLPRIIKVIGTKSIKGNQTEERPHRESYWINYSEKTSETLLKGIMSYDLNKISPHPTIDLTDRTEILKLFSTEENRLFFEGITDGQPSRSEPEYHLVKDLIKQFLPKEKVFEIMNQSKTGKWTESSMAYKELTYNKALKEVFEQSRSNDKTGIIEKMQISKMAQDLPENQANTKEKNLEKQPSKPTIEDGCNFIMSSIKEGFCDETFQVWIVFLWKQEEYFAEATSQLFEDFIRMQLLNGMGYLRDNWVKPIIRTIESKYRNNQRRLFLRSGTLDKELYYQITKNSCVVISPTRCEIIKSPYIFRTFQTQIDQTVDLTATIEDYKLLEKYTNFTTECEKELFFDILPAFFIPEISKPIILVKGEAGSAKSTLLKIMKKIIDPNLSLEEGISIPEDQKDWYVISRQHYFLFFDNVSKIEPEEQDTCCRIIQGWSMEVRKLFTDNQTMYAWLKNSIGINAIELEALQSDFLDRSLIFELKRISDEKRKGDEQFKQDFSRDLPKILGSIFKIIQKALQLLPQIAQIPQSLRLLDFVKYSAAISLARGRKAEDFLLALTDKTLLQKEESIEQSLIGQPIIKFMEDKSEWTGNMSDLVNCILKQEYGEIITENGYEKIVIGSVPRHFPQDPRVFSKELSRIGFILKSREIGFIKKRTGKERMVTLTNDYIIRNSPKPIMTTLS